MNITITSRVDVHGSVSELTTEYRFETLPTETADFSGVIGPHVNFHHDTNPQLRSPIFQMENPCVDSL